MLYSMVITLVVMLILPATHDDDDVDCGSKSQTKAKETASAEACLSVTAGLSTRHGLYQRVPLFLCPLQTYCYTGTGNGNGVLLNRAG